MNFGGDRTPYPIKEYKGHSPVYIPSQLSLVRSSRYLDGCVERKLEKVVVLRSTQTSHGNARDEYLISTIFMQAAQIQQ